MLCLFLAEEDLLHVCVFSPWNDTEEKTERLFLRRIRHMLNQTKYLQEVKYKMTYFKRKGSHLTRWYCCQRDNSRTMSQEGRRQPSRKKLASLFLLSFPSTSLSSILSSENPQPVVHQAGCQLHISTPRLECAAAADPGSPKQDCRLPAERPPQIT